MKVAEIAERLGASVDGDGDVEITGVANLQDAGEGDLTFVAGGRYAALLRTTKASAIIVNADEERPRSVTVIRVTDSQAAFQQAVMWFAPPPVTFIPGVHPTAIISDDAAIGADVYIGPHCVIEPGAHIGSRTQLVAGCYIGHRVRLGDNCRLYPNVTLREDVSIGDRVIIHSGAVIGSDGYGYHVNERGEGEKIPQLGIVTIEHDVEIGANTTIDRARFSTTRIGRGSKIDNLVQIGHNVVLEPNVGIISQVGVSGSCRVRAGAVLYGQAGLAGHLEIGAGASVGAQAGVTKDVAAGDYVSGYPAAPHDKTTKLQAHVSRLPKLKKQVRELQARIEALERAG